MSLPPRAPAAKPRDSLDCRSLGGEDKADGYSAGIEGVQAKGASLLEQCKA